MRLLIKQRVFSWTDTYDVYDEYEHPKYFVKAEFLTLGPSDPCIRSVRKRDWHGKTAVPDLAAGFRY